MREVLHIRMFTLTVYVREYVTNKFSKRLHGVAVLPGHCWMVEIGTRTMDTLKKR